MTTTVFIAVLLIVGVAWLALGRSRRRMLGLAPIALGLVLLGFSSITTVQAKEIGVLTTFGKTSDRTLSSGLHFKAPWQQVTTIDATMQTDEYRGDGCITVRLADGNTACVSATIRWAVAPGEANDVYANFRSNDPTQSLRDAVVSTQFKAAMNTVLSGYDPVAEGADFTPDYDALAKSAEDRMLTKTKGLVNVDSVTISYLTFSEKTQAKIDAFQAQVAKTRTAQEAQKTAAEEAKANKILSESISKDPNVLVSKCLDLLADAAFVPPAGFSCWPGGGSGVVIPSTN